MPEGKRRPAVMGIVNLTGDSYFAESRCLRADGRLDCGCFVRKVGKHLEEGADFIDVGACSTRPGAEGVSAEEEWRRLGPALDLLRREFPGCRLSIDTCRAAIVERARDRIGDFIVNDISAGEDDPALLSAVGKAGLTYIAMHKRGTPKTMAQLTDYGPEAGESLSDRAKGCVACGTGEAERRPAAVTVAVLDYFRAFARKAEAHGIRTWILDPGFGFAKTTEQNYRLLKELALFREINPEILVGISRKSMIYKLFNITPEEALPATQALQFAALERGATILRVHDVREAVQTATLYRMLRCDARDGQCGLR